jgi:IclR family transcriptional regulator, KDG regulon repressor
VTATPDLPSSASGLSRDLSLLQGLASEEARAHGGIGVVRLAAIVGRDKSQVSRALRALERTGLVERDPRTREYRLGWEFYALAARVGDRRLLQEAQPILQGVADRLGETTHLCVISGTGVLTLISVAPPNHAFRASGWEGRRVPAHLTSAGRCLLLDADDDELARRFAGVEFDGGGPGQRVKDLSGLRKAIRQARKDGYALVDEEFEAGLVGASAPVRDYTGRVVAAINLGAPRARMGKRLPAAGQAVAEAAQELSERLGGSPT